jgi:hypothetical protein
MVGLHLGVACTVLFQALGGLDRATRKLLPAVILYYSYSTFKSTLSTICRRAERYIRLGDTTKDEMGITL